MQCARRHGHAHAGGGDAQVGLAEDLARLLHHLGLFLVVSGFRIHLGVVREHVERVRMRQHLRRERAAFEMRARGFAELFHRGGAGARGGLVGGHGDALDPALLVQRPQRSGGDDRHAVRVRDDARCASRIAPALISGTTSGTSVFMRNARRVVDDDRAGRTAAGAKRFDCAPPAENSAMSTPSRLASVSSCTAISPPRNFIVLPAERAEASRRSSTSGNLRCSRHCMSSTPTAPVAPAMATTGFLMLRSVWSVDDIFIGSK